MAVSRPPGVLIVIRMRRACSRAACSIPRRMFSARTGSILPSICRSTTVDAELETASAGSAEEASGPERRAKATGITAATNRLTNKRRHDRTVILGWYYSNIINRNRDPISRRFVAQNRRCSIRCRLPCVVNVGGHDMQNLVNARILNDLGELRIFLRGCEVLVSVVPRELQVVRRALRVARLGKRLCQEKEKQARIGSGPLLQDRPDPSLAFKYRGIERERLAE